MDFAAILTTYGREGIAWVIVLYLLKFVLDNYKGEVDAKVKLAVALDGLSNVINRCGMNNNGNRDD